MNNKDPLEFGRYSALLARRRKLAVCATLILYLAAIAVIYHIADEATLRTALSFSPVVLAGLLGLSLINYSIRAWRWAALSDGLGFRVPIARNAIYYLAGFSMTSTPAKAGEAVRLWFLKSGHGISYTRSMPVMLADRVIDMWAILALTLISIAGFAEYRWQGATLALLVVGVSVPILFPRRFEPVFDWICVLAPRRGRLADRGREVIRAMADLSSWRNYGLTLFPTVGGWFAECIALYLVLKHFGADVTLLNAVFVFSFSLLVGTISMLPGGLGSTETTIVILLKALGVELDSALVATVIIRMTTLWFAVAIGVLLMPAAINAAARSARVAGAQSPEHM